MSGKIKAIIERHCSQLKIDRNLVSRLQKMRLDFTTRNEDHVRFFGGNLTGVEVVRFTTSDRFTWFDYILGVDEIPLERDLHALDVIETSFNVTSDTMNNTVIWLVHKLLTAKGLSKELKHQGMIDALSILNYKFFTSRLSRHFPYPADPAVAEAVYESLSRKFDIKVHGNWNAYFNARANDIINPKSIHYKTFLNMEDDIKGVRYAISDIQGRIREMLKGIANVHYRMAKEGNRINSVSATIEYDGVEVLRDKTNAIADYTRYIFSIVGERNAFIKPVLVDTISSGIMSTMPKHQFITVLEYVTAQCNKKEKVVIDEILRTTILHAFNYLYANRQMARNTNDLAMILKRLRGTYTSSRSSDPTLLRLRKITEELVQRATKNRHAGNTASVRTGLLLYIVARAMTKRHYST